MKQEIKERIELINKGIVPAGYKKTLVGICPIEWETSKLSELSTFVGGGTPSTKNRSYWEGNIPWISSSDISDEGIYNIFVKKFINEESINNSATKLIPEDSILVVTRVGVGKLAINTVKICTSQDFTNLINIKINKKFLAFYLKELINKNLKNTQGTSIKGITTKELGNYEIFSNNILEQQKIAEILDCATRQVELQEQLVDKLKVQKKALMQKLLTPQPDWQKLKLKNIINFYNGYAFKSETYVKNGAFYVITISNVKDGGFVLQEDTSTIEKIPTDIREYQILRKGDILISMTGNVGRVCKVECDNCLLNQRVGKIEVKKEFDKNFIFYSLQSYSFVEKMKLLAQGAAQDNMSVKDINNYIIYLPKNKEIQSNISNLLSNIDKRIELQQKLLEQYKLRQKSLMQLLLTGIVRVC